MANKLVHRIEGETVLVLEREFNAPRKLVFEMFTKAEHIKHFWGPRGWEVIYCTVDFRPGGVWHYCMKCEDKNQGQYFGMEAWGKAVYKSMTEPEKIEYTDYFSDKDGGENPNMPSTQVLMQLVDLGDKTKLVSRGTYASAEGLKAVIDMGMLQGISETWDRLEDRLKKLM
ncbi:MAG: SRPBCC domain-containing protein [Bdellovibrionia bacterium]